MTFYLSCLKKKPWLRVPEIILGFPGLWSAAPETFHFIEHTAKKPLKAFWLTTNSPCGI